MRIKVHKYTGVEMLRRANTASTGKESCMTLAKAYRLGHTPIRTQKFEIHMEGISQFVASQLVRQRVGVEWVMRSKRTDRGGVDFSEECNNLSESIMSGTARLHEQFASDNKDMDKVLEDIGHLIACSEIVDTLPLEFDRLAPTDLWCDINAEALMNMARKRLCRKASGQTREVVQSIKELVEEQDPDLARHMVPQCVFRGGICPESRSCGYIHSEQGQAALRFYKALFNPKQTER